MIRSQKVLASMLVIGTMGGVTSLGVFGAFSATTQNAGNEISTGTVAFSDNDAGSAMYNVMVAKPGTSVVKCIKTTYTGTLPAVVKLHTTSTPGALAQYVDLKITQGTQPAGDVNFAGCTNFAATGAGEIFNGTLAAFENRPKGYDNGLATAPAGKTSWQPGDALVFKVEATLQTTTPESGQGSSTGAHDFVWEARNS